MKSLLIAIVYYDGKVNWRRLTLVGASFTAMGMFQDTGNAFSNFVSNRILWDETMASVASRFLLRHPDYLLVGLVGGDHIKTVNAWQNVSVGPRP